MSPRFSGLFINCFLLNKRINDKLLIKELRKYLPIGIEKNRIYDIRKLTWLTLN